ncbi:unnamed protein product [Meganyctiphanes norvegica]|uniref:Malectin domain-containing protein n=1 Tax=Meganyctiphanes norvegica TaxID=48144 RepID=A0AAV2Q9W4_MEGNR
MANKAFIFSLYVIIGYLHQTNGLGEVIYAVNAGGDAHIDVYGIRYEKDPLTGKVGTASDFGKQLVIGRVPPGDQILYQTERYHHSTFGYEIPIKGDGDYVLVLKFSEVYFNSPLNKVFDVRLNGELPVITNLDIFGQVGKGVAFDQYVPFAVVGNRIVAEGHESILRGNKIKVDFVKGQKDNPKINAIFVIKGHLDDVPKLPPLPREEEPEEVEEPRINHQINNNNNNNNNQDKESSSKRRPSGPRTPDPYASDETGTMLPVFVAIGAAIPILFCLCKL